MARVACLRGTDRGRLRIGIRHARSGLVVHRMAITGDVRRYDVALVLADVRQGPDPVDIANGPELFPGPQVLVHPEPVWVRLDADGLEPDPLDARMTAGRHQQPLTPHLAAVRKTPAEPPDTPDQRDAPIRQPFLLSRIRIVGHHVVPPVQCRLHVHLRAGAELRAPWTASPGRKRDLDGMHAQYEHSPPTRSYSTAATRSPRAATAPGQCSPSAAAQREHIEIAHVGIS